MRAELQTKAWGTVRHAFDSPNCAVSVLHVEAGGYCSRHFHRERINRFLVVSGAIDVVRWTVDGRTETERERLTPGDITDVPAGIVHSFEVIEPGIVVEVYAPAGMVRQDDIVRLKLGGRA